MLKGKIGLLVVLLACSLAGCTSGGNNYVPPRPPAAQAGDGGDIAVIRPGDILEVYVLEDEAFNGKYQVRSGGHVIFPKVGRVQVAGKSLAEAERAIKASFETTQLRQASVILERQGQAGPKVADGVSVYVHGAVEEGGRRTIPYIAGEPPTVYQAILESGGFAHWANKRQVTITREGGGSQGRIVVDVQAVIEGKARDVPLLDRDIIYVKEKAFGL